MIPEKALTIAGPGAHLVGRPAGVTHVYVGPLTPSGRYVPRSGQTVCRVPRRRLTIRERRSSFAEASLPRLCARCSACLASTAAETRQASTPTSRADYQTTYADLQLLDLALAAVMADTADELDQVAHLSLLRFGHTGCLDQVTTPTGRPLGTLHQLIHRHRVRITRPGRDTRSHELTTAAIAQARAERQDLRAARDARIERLGFVNATR